MTFDGQCLVGHGYTWNGCRQTIEMSNGRNKQALVSNGGVA
jgi:hypothetical protein